MSFCEELKSLLWEKTESQLQEKKKKDRLKPCCAHAFCRGKQLFSGKRTQSHPLTQQLLAQAGEGRCEECDSLFLRSAFLFGGTVNDPGKRYHLEIRLPSPQAKEALQKVLEEKGFPRKLSHRKDKEFFYLKSSEQIEDLLTLLGAQTKALELMQTKVEKDVKNRINRLTNFEGANLQRTVYCSGRAADAISFLKQHDEFEKLPEALKKTAALRRKYPGASLSELCLYSEEHITKSGLNHRLQKIVEAAERLEKSLKTKEEQP